MEFRYLIYSEIETSYVTVLAMCQQCFKCSICIKPLHLTLTETYEMVTVIFLCYIENTEAQIHNIPSHTSSKW